MRLIRKSIYNINAVIRSDIRRLGRSVVSFVIVLGLILLPCLYSWFNTISNWDPYSATSTGNLKVAVYNEDVGITLMGVNVNVGGGGIVARQTMPSAGSLSALLMKPWKAYTVGIIMPL